MQQARLGAGSFAARSPRNFAGACPGPQGLGSGLTGLVSIKKSPGGRQAKGWETAETAVAEAGFLGCKGDKKEGFHPLRY